MCNKMYITLVSDHYKEHNYVDYTISNRVKIWHGDHGIRDEQIV